ncbi:MAG: ribbon-helix-helix protein, CopG family [Roseburia sp.]|nr:ribbon-helix-helix protein, CopG family [Roseburia sp.]
MAREKKDGRHINLYIEREIIEALEQYCEEVGQTKTVAIERAIKQYISDFQEHKIENSVAN